MKTLLCFIDGATKYKSHGLPFVNSIGKTLCQVITNIKIA